MRRHESSAGAAATGLRVLVADDDARVRSLIAALLRATEGVAEVLEAGDGVEAVAVGREERPDLAVLDLNMPELDGVEAALRLLALERPPRIALHSADPDSLRQRADGLELPLFDKADVEGLLAWVKQQRSAPCITAHSRARATSRDTARDVLEIHHRHQPLGKFLQTNGWRCPRWRAADHLLR